MSGARNHGGPTMTQTTPHFGGSLVDKSTLAGQTRREGVYPGHGDAFRVGRDRWLILYSNRGFMGDDNYKSLIYQLRRDRIDGDLVKEGIFEASRRFRVAGDESDYSTQLGAPGVFGVPKGVTRPGLATAANLFVAKYYVRYNRLRYDADNRPRLSANMGAAAIPNLPDRDVGMCWAQFRLNEREDDIEMIQPPTALVQKGFEASDDSCELGSGVHVANHGFSRPFLIEPDRPFWCDVHCFGGARGGIAPVGFEFNAATSRYDWVRVGTPLRDPDYGIGEPSMVPYKGRFILAARTGEKGCLKPGWRMKKGTIAWAMLDDPFDYAPLEFTYPEDGRDLRAAPMSLARTADGVIRLFSNDHYNAPYPETSRNPLYIWRIDPEDSFRRSDRQVVFDGVALGLPGLPEASFVHLAPHAGGDRQAFTHFVAHGLTDPYTEALQALNPRCIESRLYYGEVQLEGDVDGEWEFAASGIS